VSRRRRTIAVALPAVVAVAVLGYLAGHHRSSASSEASVGEAARSATGSNFRLEYPASWRQSPGSSRTPDIGVVGQLLLTPRAAGADAGLLVGQIAAGQSGPLPARLRSLLGGPPRVAVVNLQAAQAFSYSGLHVTGYNGTLDLYVIPNRGPRPLVLACYAASGLAAYLSGCDQIAATVEPTGASEYDLTPDGAYARQLQTLVAILNAQRLPLRRAIRSASSADPPLAEELAARFDAADASLNALKAPLAVDAAQTALASAMSNASAAYRALAFAPAVAGPAHTAAVARVEQAEAAVDSALEGFALLGYGEGQGY
jgi:hypothetical protein